MGVVIRQSLFSTIFSYLGVVLGYFNVLWLFPTAMSTSEIGLFRVVQDMAILLSAFAQMGLAQSTTRFFPFFSETRKDRNKLLRFLLFGSLIGYLLFLILFVFLKQPIIGFYSDKAPEVGNHIRLALILTLILVFTAVLETYAKSLLKTIVPNFIKDVLLRVFTGIAVLLFLVNLIDYGILINSLVIIFGLSLLFLFAYLIFLGELELSLKFGFPEWPSIKKIVHYALYASLGASSAIIVSKIDNLMIGSLLGLDYSGIYTTVFYIAVVIEIPKRAISQISYPIMADHFKAGNRDIEINTLYKSVSLHQLLAGILIFVLITTNLDSLFQIMPNGESFEVGKTVVIIIGAAKLIDMTASINSEIIILSKYYRVNLLMIAILAVTTILSNLILIPTYGINGAAIASAFSVLMFNLSKFLFIKLKLGYDPLTTRTLLILLEGAILYLAAILLPSLGNPYLDVFVKSASVLILFVGINFLLPASPEIKTLLSKSLNTIIKRLK
ncbi:MAG: oligosaccharide flippase family protein [Bacteroidota bacterium]